MSERTLSERFHQAAEATPDKLALCCEGQRLSYAALARMARRLGAAMTAEGVAHGDAVAVVLPNTPAFVALLLTAADLGLTLVPLSPALPPPALSTACRAARVKHVVGSLGVLEELKGSGLLPLDIAAGLWLSVGGPIPGGHDWTICVDAAPDAAPHFAGRNEDAFILTMTSGSTGDPKPIILTQRTKLQRAAAAQALYGVNADDITLAATPLYHSLAERLVLLPLITGGTSVLMARFSPSEWLRHVAEEGVTFTIAVSSQLSQILPALKTATTPEHNLVASLRCLVSSSARLDPQTKAEWLAHFHGEFHECYGASEIAIATNLSTEEARDKLKSVGRAAPGVDVKILAENGAWADTGEVGEIVCRTPMLFGGYYLRDDLTRAAMHGDYFRTGDLGRLDADGFLYFMGRAKELIISGGINVYPADVESAVAAAPGVAECAAFPLHDAGLGEVVGVALVARAGEEVNLRTLRHHCARTLADFQLPRKFFVLPQLPRNGMGKIMKSALVAEFGGNPNDAP